MDVRILLVEDDEDLRERLLEVLEEEGYQVTAVGSGADAIAAAQQTGFDLVLTDIRMPGIDGLEALSQVRQTQPHVSSLVLTGYSSEADSVRAIGLGVGEYLKKPFRLDDFLRAVRRLVDKRREQVQAREREQALLATAQAALELVARQLGASQAVGASRLAGRVAGPGTRERMELATFVLALERLHPELPLEPLLASLPATTRTLLALAREDDPELSQPDARLIRGVLSHTGLLEAEIEENVRQAVAQASHAPASHAPVPDHAADSESGRRRRSLLSLAQGLEEGGDLDNASVALQELLQLGTGHSEEVEALLGLARIAAQRGRLDDCKERAQDAFRRSQALGPVCAGETAHQVGVLLARRGLPEGRACLERAQEWLRSTASPVRQAQNRLALASQDGSPFAEADLQLLLNQGEALIDSAPWLLPALLRAECNQELWLRVMRRLAREAPQTLEQALLEDTPRRVEAVRLLRDEDVLRRLMAVPELESAAREALAGESADPVVPLLRLHSFGPFTVHLGSRRVPDRSFRGLYVRWILARLASRPDHTFTTENLVDEFWPEDFEAGRRNLYWAVSVLRRCLAPGDYVLRVQQGLRFNAELPRLHDFEEFHRLHAESERLAAAGQTEAAMGVMRSILRLYRGPYLEGCYYDWALSLRNDAERVALETGRALVRLCLQSQRHLEAVENAYRVLEWDNCCQESYLGAMQANLALNRPQEAVRLYERCQKVLKRELGLEPSTDILREHQRALLTL